MQKEIKKPTKKKKKKFVTECEYTGGKQNVEKFFFFSSFYLAALDCKTCAIIITISFSCSYIFSNNVPGKNIKMLCSQMQKQEKQKFFKNENFRKINK